MKITNDIIESYFDCKLKSYLKRKGEQGQVNQIEDHYRSKLQRYREQVFQERFATPLRDGHAQIQSLSTFKLTDAIYNVRVNSEHFDLFCDVLIKKRVKGKLVLVPVLVLPTETIEQKYKILISFIATELSRLLNCSIEYSEIIYSTKMMSKKIYLDRYSKHVRAISLSMEDQNSPFFYLNAHCSICEFQTTCRERAKASDHLSQLRGIGAEKIKKIESKRNLYGKSAIIYFSSEKKA